MAEEKPAFKISILASGSSGNSLYIESDKKRLLVDAGLSGKKLLLCWHKLIGHLTN